MTDVLVLVVLDLSDRISPSDADKEEDFPGPYPATDQQRRQVRQLPDVLRHDSRIDLHCKAVGLRAARSRASSRRSDPGSGGSARGSRRRRRPGSTMRSAPRWRTASRAWRRSSLETPRARWRRARPTLCACAVSTSRSGRCRQSPPVRIRTGVGPAGTCELVDDGLALGGGELARCRVALCESPAMHARERAGLGRLPEDQAGHTVEGRWPVRCGREPRSAVQPAGSRHRSQSGIARHARPIGLGRACCPPRRREPQSGSRRPPTIHGRNATTRSKYGSLTALWPYRPASDTVHHGQCPRPGMLRVPTQGCLVPEGE